MFETIRGIIGDIAAGTIKDQRIALSQEQLGLLDLKFKEALEQNTVLAQKVAGLERLVADRNAEIERFRARAQRKKSDDPTDIQLRILVAISRNKNITAPQIAERLQIGPNIAEQQLEILSDAGKIFTEGKHYGVPGSWGILAPGRDCLIERGLLE